MSVLKCMQWILTACTVFCFACFPNKTAEHIAQPALAVDTRIKVPVKAFFSDGSQIIFPEGFEIVNRMVIGRGSRYSIHGVSGPVTLVDIPLDSISAMNYYHLESPGGSVLGSVLLGIYGVTIAPLSVYCLICPKCCFGSCPTLYANDRLQAELFSYNISHYFQEIDLDRLDLMPDDSGRFGFTLANEALETHYINVLAPLQVTHPQNTHAFAGQNQEIVVIGEMKDVLRAQNSEGQDITQLLNQTDSDIFRSDSLFSKRLEATRLTDWITLDIQVAPDQ